MPNRGKPAPLRRDYFSFMKRVAVQMTDEMHQVLKAFAAFHNRSMSDVLEEIMENTFNAQRHQCLLVERLFDSLRIEPDKRAQKICFSPSCIRCKNRIICSTGEFEGCLEVEDRLKHLLTDDYKRKLKELQIAHGQEPQSMES